MITLRDKTGIVKQITDWFLRNGEYKTRSEVLEYAIISFYEHTKDDKVSDVVIDETLHRYSRLRAIQKVHLLSKDAYTAANCARSLIKLCFKRVSIQLIKRNIEEIKKLHATSRDPEEREQLSKLLLDDKGIIKLTRKVGVLTHEGIKYDDLLKMSVPEILNRVENWRVLGKPFNYDDPKQIQRLSAKEGNFDSYSPIDKE